MILYFLAKYVSILCLSSVFKALVKKIREDGLRVNVAIDWIKLAAPHEKQAGLLDDWRDFTEDAETYLLDDWDTTYSGALRFLSENCHIQKSAKK